MKQFTWNNDKNKTLRKVRNISFEDVVFYIQKGHLLATLTHPNQEKYPNQKLFVINIENYAYLVLFIEDETHIFLKTIIPSRKATEQYLR